MRPLTAVLLVLLGAALALARDVTVAWDANPPEEAVEGYRVHWGTASRTYDRKLDVGNVTTAPVLLQYYLAVTAYRGTLESDYSNELTIAADCAPVTLRLSPPPQPPQPAELWLVAPNGTATTRPVYDRLLFVTGTRKEVGRVAIGAVCKEAVGAVLNWRAAAGSNGAQGVSYCLRK